MSRKISLVLAVVLAVWGMGTAFAQAAGTAPAGVLVAQVYPGTPADKAGIARGDIIVSADGKDVNSVNDLVNAVDAHKAGDTMSLTVKHGDTQKSVTVTLADQGGSPYLGIDPYGLAMRMGRPGQAVPVQQGAIVAQVVAGGPADKAGLKGGDVILSVDGTQISPTNDLAPMIAQHKPGDTVTLSVKTDNQQPRDVKVILDKNPQNASAAYLGVQYSPAEGGFGMMFGNPGFPNQFMFPLQGQYKISQGALVDTVDANGPAAKAGVKPRDIITAVDTKNVVSPRQVLEQVAAHKVGDSLTLTVFRFADNKSTQIKVTLAQTPQGAQGSGPYLGMTMERFMSWEGPDVESVVPTMRGYRDMMRVPRGGVQQQTPPVAVPAPGGV